MRLVLTAPQRRLFIRNRQSLKLLNLQGSIEVAERGEEFVRLLQGLEEEAAALAALCVCLGIEALGCGDYSADATS